MARTQIAVMFRTNTDRQRNRVRAIIHNGPHAGRYTTTFYDYQQGDPYAAAAQEVADSLSLGPVVYFGTSNSANYFNAES